MQDTFHNDDCAQNCVDARVYNTQDADTRHLKGAKTDTNNIYTSMLSMDIAAAYWLLCVIGTAP